MSTTELPVKAGDLRRIRWIQSFTILWMIVEVVGSAIGAFRARSPSLLAFGGDSAIELLSAAVVLWRFRQSPSTREQADRRATQVAAGLLFLLAAFVVIASAASLLGHFETRPSLIGIGLLIAASGVMPWLAQQKRRLSAATSSGVLRADAAQSALCGYMAWIALAGLAVNTIWGKSWADPLAALALTPLILREGWKAFHSSKLCCD